jgi:hypothetical protein
MADRVTVYDSRIQQAFAPGGTVYGNVRRVAFRNLKWAQEYAPVRTGYMRDTLTMSLTPRGKLEWQYTIRSAADYLPFTIVDTGPWIFPKNGPLLWVRPAPHSWYALRTPRLFVQGYQSINWLEDSKDQTLYEEGLV